MDILVYLILSFVTYIATKLPLKLEGPPLPLIVPSQGHGPWPLKLEGLAKIYPSLPLSPIITPLIHQKPRKNSK